MGGIVGGNGAAALLNQLIAAGAMALSSLLVVSNSLRLRTADRHTRPTVGPATAAPLAGAGPATAPTG